jgi:hypothetical protein
VARTDVRSMLMSQSPGEPVAFAMSLNAEGMSPQFGAVPDAFTLEAYQTTLKNDHWVGELNHMRDAVKDQIKSEQQVLASSVAITGGLSVGYVIWLLRGGLLLTSLLSSLPAWHVIDPMPVLARAGARDDEDTGDDDPLESLFGKVKARIEGVKSRSPAGTRSASEIEATQSTEDQSTGWAT